MIGGDASRTFGTEGRGSSILQLLLGTLVVVTVGYAGIMLAPAFGLTAFWPYAGLWAALGWGTGRVSLKPVFALIFLGLAADLILGAPLGCWVSIHLFCFMIVTLFQKRAASDKTGIIRLLAFSTGLLSSFLFARWIMGAFLGEMTTGDILGGFLSAALLYLFVRPIFVIRQANQG